MKQIFCSAYYLKSSLNVISIPKHPWKRFSLYTQLVAFLSDRSMRRSRPNHLKLLFLLLESCISQPIYSANISLFMTSIAYNTKAWAQYKNSTPGFLIAPSTSGCWWVSSTIHHSHKPASRQLHRLKIYIYIFFFTT